jgi:glycosyltransferase involved in cell wall biosynthesis
MSRHKGSSRNELRSFSSQKVHSLFSTRPIKICFVAPFSYSLFNQNTRFRFGGSEVRAVLFGKGLADLAGYEVTFVVYDHGQEPIERFGNIHVYAHSGYRPISYSRKESRYQRYRADLAQSLRKSGGGYQVRLQNLALVTLLKACFVLGIKAWSWLRAQIEATLFGLRIDGHLVSPSKLAVYKTVDADIYCVFGVHELAAEVFAFCRKAGKSSLLFLASDANLSKDYQRRATECNSHGYSCSLCRYALDQADLIVAQTRSQACLLRSRFGRQATTITNPIDPEPMVGDVPIYADREFVLWVGRSHPVKDPLSFLQLVHSAPEVKFLMVLNRSDSSLFDQVLQNKPDNLEIRIQIPYRDMEAFFARALVLVNTSTLEGFPNTFLQASKYGVPILSLNVDPEGIIEARQAGIVAHGSFENLVDGLRTILDETQNPVRFHHNAKELAADHQYSEKIEQLNEFIRHYLCKKQTSRRGS